MARDASRSLLDLLDRVEMPVLKRLSKITGGPVNVNRPDLVAWLRIALDEPQRVSAALDQLRPLDRSLLAILHVLGGEAEDDILRAAFFASGVEMLPTTNLKSLFNDHLSRLMHSGLLLIRSETLSLTRLQRFSYRDEVNLLFSDDRILSQAGRALAVDPGLTPTAPEQAGERWMARSPRLMTMLLVSLVQSIASCNGLKLTQAGEVRATEKRKLLKLMGWEDENLADGGLVFHDALDALIGAFTHAGLLERSEGSSLRLSAFGGEFLTLPVEEQVRRLAVGMLRVKTWQEGVFNSKHPTKKNYTAARAGLFFLLYSLPATPNRSFYRVDSLDLVLYERIGSFFTLNEEHYRFYDRHNDLLSTFIRASGPTANIRDAWLKVERRWLDQALLQWFYFFGMVELAFQNDRLSAVRLTELGCAVLHPELAPKTLSKPLEEGPAWIIQPNFDIVVYLNRLASAQLAFIERHTERQSVQEHLAQYRLTRDSVYRGLEGGTRPEELVATLEQGAGRPLPQNITTEIREWAAQRERIGLWRRATLAEFPDAKARDGAARAGLQGAPLGERFMLLKTPPARPLLRVFKQTVNYALGVQRNLVMSENGVVGYNRPLPDLLLDARLSAWTETQPGGEKQFTRASVQAAVAAGRSLNGLLRLLEDRQYKMTPSILKVSLNAWAGEKYSVGLGQVLVLRVVSPNLNFAIQQSELLRPYLAQTVTPGIYLVHPDQADALRQALEKLGLTVGGGLSLF